ncbi:cytochrome P450 [Coprinopsis cinerea AmutBmut pab1-1]|nr:cytochrome P450 [Coprinopsis cinerea AmutBmut pab1-1]
MDHLSKFDLSDISTPTLACGAASLALLLAYAKSRRSSRPPKPPGPKGYPIIGNLFDIPQRRVWEGYKELSEKYGDMVYVEAFGQSILVVSSLKRVKDLFDKRQNIYSDRPCTPMLVDLMDFGHYMSVMPYDNWYKRHRKVFRQQAEHNVAAWHPVIKSQAIDFLKSVLATPENWSVHVKQLFSATVVEITYGVKTSSPEDPFTKDMNQVADGFGEAALPGRFLVDVFPFLKYVPSWLPGAGFKRFAEYYKDLDHRARNKPFDHVLKAMKAGTSPPCMVSNMVSVLPEEGSPARSEEEQIARNVASITHAAGAETSMGTATAFYVFMALNPEVQRRAQEELDRVVGPVRLPEINDREGLVYITAILKEVLRMHQTTPMALPHSAATDDIYDGYFIPKGTVVLGNAWQILHDPEVFDEPFAFKPERYIKDGKIDHTVVDATAAAFGYGRRICPGRHMAMDTLFYTIACTLAMFDIAAPKDENGEPTIRYETTDGALSHPVPVQCFLTPRSPEHARYIRSL